MEKSRLLPPFGILAAGICDRAYNVKLLSTDGTRKQVGGFQG